MISQYVANMIKFLVDSYNNPIPAILEIPSKDHPYDPTHDSVLSRLSVSPKGRIVGKTTKDANRMKRKIKTFKAPRIMDEALRVPASPSLPCTIDGASSPYVSSLCMIGTK